MASSGTRTTANIMLTARRRCSRLASMPIGGNEAEWLTRKKRIDTKLRSLNPPWQIIPWHDGLDTSKLSCHAVTEFPTASGPADYAFFVSGVSDLPHTSHADQLVKTCRDVFKQGDDFVKKITGNANVDRPLQRIREFRNRL